MGLTQKLGTLPIAVYTDTSNNVGIGGAPSGSYKFEVTGTGNISGALTAASFNGLTYTNSGAYMLTTGSTKIQLNQSELFSSAGASNRAWAFGLAYAAAGDFNIMQGTTATGGTYTPKLTISSGGNVGIGTTSPSVLLHILGGNEVLRLDTSSTAYDAAIRWYNNSSATYWANIQAGPAAISGGGMLIQANGAYPMAFYTNGTERMRITSGGNVGIGVTPYSWDSIFTSIDLTNKGSVASYTNYLQLIQNGYYGSSVWKYKTTGFISAISLESDSGDIVFRSAVSGTANATATLNDRMRILNGGDVNIGATANTNGHQFFMASGNGAYQAIGHPSGASTGYSYTLYLYAGSAIGSIGQSGTTAVVYNTNSDYRLKEVISPIQNAVDTLLKLKPISFKWKNTEDEYGEGFLAHELQEVIPLAVTGEKDAVDEDGNIKPQQVDNSKIVPYLVKAIQELSAQNQELKDILKRNNLS